MFCAACGTKLEDDSKFCRACGRSVPATSEQSEVDRQAVGAPTEAPALLSSDAAAGVAGWLMFFSVTWGLGVILHIYILFFLLRIAGSGKTSIASQDVYAGVVVGAFFVCASTVGLIFTLKRSKWTPLYWTIAIPLAAFASFTLEVVMSEQIGLDSSGQMTPEMAGALRGMIVAFIWWLYWLISRRVKRTYGSRGIGILWLFARRRHGSFK